MILIRATERKRFELYAGGRNFRPIGSDRAELKSKTNEKRNERIP